MPDSLQLCPQCGSTLGTVAARGLCPSCVMERCLGAEDDLPETGEAVDAKFMEGCPLPPPKTNITPGRFLGD